MFQVPSGASSRASSSSRPLRTLALVLGLTCVLPALQGCGVMAVAGATAGAAISITGAVVSTGVSLTGKAVGAAIDLAAAPSDKPQTDKSGNPAPGVSTGSAAPPAPAASAASAPERPTPGEATPYPIR